GLIVLVVLVAGWPWPRHDPAPVIVRRALYPFASQFVYFFAVAPAFAGTLVAVLIGWTAPVGGIAPLVILSGLLVVVAAGEGIGFNGQHGDIGGGCGGRQTGAPLKIVAGAPRTAALIALGAPSRPSVFLDATPERSPWVTPDAIKSKGAIVVWPTTDTAGTPPAGIQETL